MRRPNIVIAPRLEANEAEAWGYARLASAVGSTGRWGNDIRVGDIDDEGIEVYQIPIYIISAI
jgi:hypothetical protein